MSLTAVLVCIGLIVSVVRGGNPSVCYEMIGCFDTGEPWSSAFRNAPPPKGPLENPATVYFYSRQNSLSSYNITTYPEINMGGAPFDGKLETVVIVHGHGENVNTGWMLPLKDAYLKRLDANVLLTDWEQGAAATHSQSVSNTRVVARLIVRLLKYLMDNYGLEANRVHLIGHSLGAQVAALIAKETPRIKRLTILDPPQQLYEDHGSQISLTDEDATLVEVVHTNTNLFVMASGRESMKGLGHIDFFFNGGVQQPGCIIPKNLPNVTSLTGFTKWYDNYTSLCSRERAHQYLIEAYNHTNDCVFWAHRAADFSGIWTTNSSFWNFLQMYFLRGTVTDSVPCGIDECIPFDFDDIYAPQRGAFAVRTNAQSPYCITKRAVPITLPQFFLAEALGIN